MSLQEIDRVMKDEVDLPAYLTLDEMKISENLVLVGGKIVGFVDNWNDTAVASKILVYYLRTVKKEISLPLAWYATTDTHASILALTFWEILFECESRDVHIHALIADGHASNRKMFKILSEVTSLPLTHELSAVNPYTNSPIHLCSDVSHLLKTVRNGLFASKSNGTRYMNMSGNPGEDILWKHVVELYKKESSLPLTSWTRLTQAHIDLNCYSKMKLNLARGVINWKVGQAMREYIPEATGTAEFILLFSRWYEIMSCNEDPIYSLEDNRIIWLKQVFLEKMYKWESNVRTQHTGETKRMLSMQTFEGLCFTTHNFIRLCEILLPLPEINFICFSTFTQDVLEAFFGNLRQLGRFSQNPDLSQIAYGFQHIVQRKSIKRMKGGNTTFGSKNSWTVVSNDPIAI